MPLKFLGAQNPQSIYVSNSRSWSNKLYTYRSKPVQLGIFLEIKNVILFDYLDPNQSVYK